MDKELVRFYEMLHSVWLPSFCEARANDFQPEGIRESSIERITTFDAHWFLRAMDAELVNEEGGFFRAPRSEAKEQIFFGLKQRGAELRNIFLWAEPVITIGACARLNQQYEWPAGNIGMQSKYPWPFDLVCYAPGRDQEIIVCEVKKCSAEITKLIEYMQSFCSVDALGDEPEKPAVKNAYRKVVGIRKTWPKLFWALGPNGVGHCFKVNQIQGSERFSMDQVDEKWLQVRNLT